MASAFISYAHEDQEFVLLLVEHLQAQGLAVSYDRVALHIGDSLIQAISQEVTEGDFLIAVVSPASLSSAWCQHEVALAMTQGINQQRVKVLPVSFGGAAMPPMLQDTVWGDADTFDVATLARRLAAAMTAHLEGREAEAAREAAAVEDAGGTPVHAEVAGDVTVAQLDALAGKVMDVLGLWADVWGGVANIRDVLQEQRHLRWAIEVLPDRARVGLPLGTTACERRCQLLRRRRAERLRGRHLRGASIRTYSARAGPSRNQTLVHRCIHRGGSCRTARCNGTSVADRTG